jgi:hypothetical protein
LTAPVTFTARFVEAGLRRVVVFRAGVVLLARVAVFFRTGRVGFFAAFFVAAFFVVAILTSCQSLPLVSARHDVLDQAPPAGKLAAQSRFAWQIIVNRKLAYFTVVSQ